MKPKIFAVGFFLGAVCALIPRSQIYLKLILESVYPMVLLPTTLAIVWGILFGATLVGCQSILEKEGARGLVRLAILIGIFVVLFWLISTQALL